MARATQTIKLYSDNKESILPKGSFPQKPLYPTTGLKKSLDSVALILPRSIIVVLAQESFSMSLYGGLFFLAGQYKSLF